ncbi:MAG: hypothetical protein AAFX78_04505 [Cyanobacteria bacterium J06638_20]
MSDYLSNLIARTANQSETIQPRLQSLFEPIQGMGEIGWPGDADLDLEVSLVEPDRSVPSPAQPRIPAQPTVSQPPVPTRMNPDSVSPTPPSIQDLSPPTPARIETPTGMAAEPPPLVDDASRKGRSQPDPRLPIIQREIIPPSLPTNSLQGSLQPVIHPVLTEHTVVERIFETEPTAASARMTANTELQASETAIAPPSIPEATPVSHQPPSASSKKMTETELPTPFVPAATTVISTPVTPQIRPAPPSEPPIEAPPPAPTIQVTIGRIEVRATPSRNAPSAKPRQPSSVMSLEDYLRQQGGGS